MRRFDRYSGPHDERYFAARRLLAPSATVIEVCEVCLCMRSSATVMIEVCEVCCCVRSFATVMIECVRCAAL